MSESTPNQSAADEPELAVLRRRLEAVLLMARGPITSRKLSKLAGLEDGTQSRTMIRELNRHYDQIGRAFHIKRLAGGYQMLTRPQFANWIDRLDRVPRRQKLSKSAMETLTVVAYRQPIIKADIEAIRGVSCGEMLRQLLESNQVRIVGRSENLGRPYLYGTTRQFLANFGFASIRELPEADHLAGQGLPDWATHEQNLQSVEEPQPGEETESSDVKETQA
jgi:segregation and condensation protein B